MSALDQAKGTLDYADDYELPMATYQVAKAHAYAAIAQAEQLKRIADNQFQQIPEALNYILWRYSSDHQGEDHQARAKEVAAWLDTIKQAHP